jgi:hypothetical protein
MNAKEKLVPGTGIEPVRPLFRKAADFKSAVSTYFTTRAHLQLSNKNAPYRRTRRKYLEARAGVEPTYTDLQSGA